MPSTNASTVSVAKTSAAPSVASCPNDNSQRRKSCDTVCSSNSSCFLQRRKQPHPLASSVRTSYGTRSTGNVVKQRVLSAKLLKFRSIQSQLNDANFHLVELAKENRALKVLQRRQDKALSNYEGVNADLPRLIKSHEEEIRVLQEKNKILRKNLKEVSEQLKTKDEELIHVKQQLKHLQNLTKDKNLQEREKLTEQVEELKEKLSKSEEQISVLNRKLMLEAKNAKFKVNCEINKYKQSQKDLGQALSEVDRLTALLEARGKFISANVRGKKIPNRQSISLVSLGPNTTATSEKDGDNEKEKFKEKEDNRKYDQSNLKLEPISNTIKENEYKSLENGVLNSPIENIKARLSANIRKYKSQDLEFAKSKLGTLNLSETDLTDFQQTKSIYTVSSQNIRKSRPNSSQKLEKLDENIQKVCFSSENEVDQVLGDYCTQIVSSVKNCNKMVNQHKESLDAAKTTTDNILATLKETDELNKKLIQNKSLLKEDFEIPEKDLDLVNKIWKDEYSFQRSLNRSPSSINKYDMLSRSFDKNGNNSAVKNSNVNDEEQRVSAEEKRKLLATLRAIDNGESVEDSVSSNSSFENGKKLNVAYELFGEAGK